tara:strand:+ start:409 stop:540 length:132 start_codon:yes stop_codon:yes gene_type:complete
MKAGGIRYQVLVFTFPFFRGHENDFLLEMGIHTKEKGFAVKTW